MCVEASQFISGESCLFFLHYLEVGLNALYSYSNGLVQYFLFQCVMDDD